MKSRRASKVIRRHFNRGMKYMDKYGFADKRTRGALADMADQIMEIKLAPKLFDALVRNLRDVVSIIRSQERMVMQICVRDAGMPRKDFLSSFPKNETDHDLGREAHSRQAQALVDTREAACGYSARPAQVNRCGRSYAP